MNKAYAAAVESASQEIEQKSAIADAAAGSEGRKSVATVLVDIATELYTFRISTDGEAFSVPKQGAKVVALLRGGKTSLRNQLAKEYFTRYRRAAPQQALADALLVLEGVAQEAETVALHLRVAQHDGDTWLDLGDTTGRAIQVTANGWEVRQSSPVLFKRTALTAPLPVPERGEDLSLLWQRLNVCVDDRPVILAWMLLALLPDLPHPVLAVDGEQGTGKSTALRTLVSCIDPSPVPLRKPPRDPDSWVTAAAGSWVVGLDNLSAIPDWLSDSLCRAVTGDGDVRRKLYTDSEHAVFAFRRCIMLNSIDLGSVRGDLAERMLPITLDRIQDARRATEVEMAKDWDTDHPKILGALLTSLASVKYLMPTIELKTKPRMADFAEVLATVDILHSTEGLAHYLAKQGTLAVDSLASDAFVAAIYEKCRDGFNGTAAELLCKLTPDRPPRGWPLNPRAATQRLRRHSPALRKAGWEIFDDSGCNKGNTVCWTIRPEMAGISSSPSSSNSPISVAASRASQASNQYRRAQDVCKACDGEGCPHCSNQRRE
jgi:hypothetical protein